MILTLFYNDITTVGRNLLTEVIFKNCAPFIKYISKTGRTAIANAEDLDLVIPMYNIIECSSNYSDTTGSIWFYSKNKAVNFNADIVDISGRSRSDLH